MVPLFVERVKYVTDLGLWRQIQTVNIITGHPHRTCLFSRLVKACWLPVLSTDWISFTLSGSSHMCNPMALCMFMFMELCTGSYSINFLLLSEWARRNSISVCCLSASYGTVPRLTFIRKSNRDIHWNCQCSAAKGGMVAVCIYVSWLNEDKHCLLIASAAHTYVHNYTFYDGWILWIRVLIKSETTEEGLSHLGDGCVFRFWRLWTIAVFVVLVVLECHGRFSSSVSHLLHLSPTFSISLPSSPLRHWCMSTHLFSETARVCDIVSTWTMSALRQINLLTSPPAGLSNPVDTVFHLQPVMILTLLPLAILVDGWPLSLLFFLFPPSFSLPLLHSFSPTFISSPSLFQGVHIGTSEVVFRASSFQELPWTSVIILTASVVAFGLGTSEYLLVYHTSGLTLSVAGVLKVGFI